MSLAAIVPVRSFRGAKQRLATHLGDADREHLARELTIGVLIALADLPTYVVTGDAEVAQLAATHGVTTVEDPASGLDAAVDAAADVARSAGYRRLLVAHSDLPFPAGLRDVAAEQQPGEVLLVPDRHDDGTNVIVMPATPGFRTSYGPGSFRRHLREAHRRGLRPHVVRHDLLGWDVDVPEDLDTPPTWGIPSWRAVRR